MSNTIDKQATLEWIKTRKDALEQLVVQHTGMHKRHLTGQHSSLVDLEWEIQSGRFDSASDQGEVQRLQQEISTYKAWQPNAWENAQKLEAYGRLIALINFETHFEKNPREAVRQIKELIDEHVGINAPEKEE